VTRGLRSLHSKTVVIIQFVCVSKSKFDSVVNIKVVGWFMVFNATFNNISVAISWRSVLFGGETGENHRPVACY